MSQRSPYKYNSFRYLTNKEILRIFLVIIFTMAISACVMYLLYELFIKLQTVIYHGGILLAHNKFVVWDFFIFGSIFYFIAMMMIENDYITKYTEWYIKKHFKFNLHTFITLIFIIFIFSVIYLFGSYIKVAEDGIFYKPNIFQKEFRYDWNDVKGVNIYYYSLDIRASDHKYVQIHYDLKLDDGRIFNLAESSQFWDKIIEIDDYIKSLNIDIYRKTINENYMTDLLRYKQVDDTKGLNVLKNIFDVKYTIPQSNYSFPY